MVGIHDPDPRLPTSDLSTGDSIAAVATAPGGAARGVVRVSGPDAVAIAADVFTADIGTPVGQLTRPTTIIGQVSVSLDDDQLAHLPCDLQLWPGNRSYTREPLAELHTIGSPPLVDAVLAAVCRRGARLAEPGEFTLRAFLAGRIDLTQAEAVLGVIDAHGPAEYRTALAQLAGGLGRPLDALRDDLLQMLAELEAGLDFVEEDIEFITRDEIARRLSVAAEQVAGVQRQMASRSDAPPARQAVLMGPPNVGKSSLFNALVERFGVARDGSRRASAGAIVSPQCGTTRDYLVAELDLDGVRCQLIDTAGLGDELEDESDIQRAAQSFSTERGRQATLRLVCTDAWPSGDFGDVVSHPSAIPIVMKADLLQPEQRIAAENLPVPLAVTSSHTGQGLDELAAAMRATLETVEAETASDVVATTAARCRECLRLAGESLATALELTDAGGGDELIAAEIRNALNELGKIVGAVCTDDILDRVFSSFCIGK